MTILTNAQLAAIRERRERTKNMAAIGHRDLMENVSQIPALLDTIAELREVLAWYADPLNYNEIDGEPGEIKSTGCTLDYPEGEWAYDEGSRARAVLARMEVE